MRLKPAAIAVVFFLFLPGCKNSRPTLNPAVRQWGEAGNSPGCFTSPRAVACLGEEIFVIDKTGRVQVFSREGTHLRQWYLPDQEYGTPTSISIGPDGNLWIPDTHNSRILIYDTSGKLKKTFGTYGTGQGQFAFVTGVAHSPSGDFYICEYGSEDRVQQFKSDGTFVRSFGGSGTDPGRLRRPMALVYHPSGRLYVADASNHRIQCFSPSGEYLLGWGEHGKGPGQFAYPYDIAMDNQGFLYVCEFGNHRVQKFSPSGRYVASWGGPGIGPGGLFAPWGVALDDTGSLYIADTGNHRIVVVQDAASAGITEEAADLGSTGLSWVGEGIELGAR